MERVDELASPPIVGQEYLVTCIEVTDEHARQAYFGGIEPGWWPVLGPQHEDAALIDFPEHWHYDYRFLTEAQYRNRAENSSAVDRTGDERYLLAFPLTTYGQTFVASERVRRCERTQLAWPETPTWRAKLERMTAAAGHTRLKSCKVCPHRGVPLASVPVVDGMITCPGHTLRWDAGTGDLIRTPGPARCKGLTVVGQCVPRNNTVRCPPVRGGVDART